jgi:hypothetical protein
MRAPHLLFPGHYSVACLAADLSDSVSQRTIAETGNAENPLRGLECMKGRHLELGFAFEWIALKKVAARR